MKRYAITAVLALVCACDSGGGGGSSDPALACTIEPGQLLSAPCCEGHGVDACGAGLFCAAFDGRTQSACYAERSRADGDACTEDRQCASNSCNAEAGACRSATSACSLEIGCAPSADGTARFCAVLDGQTEPSCQLEHSLGDGQTCTEDRQCKSNSCNLEAGKCRAKGSACSPNVGCAPAADGTERACVGDTCERVGDGSEGATCATNAQCNTGLCAANTCRVPSVCSPDEPSDGRCSAGSTAEACYYCMDAIGSCAACDHELDALDACLNAHVDDCRDAACMVSACGTEYCSARACVNDNCAAQADCG